MSVWSELADWIGRRRLAVKRIIGMPLVGEVHHRFLMEPPRLPDNRFGKTTKMPTILEIYISEDHQWPLDIGSKVKQIYFKDYPPIVFNVCFSCARPSWYGVGDYGNPLSHWFNVFFGFYEIDVPKSRWKRPFGFESAEGFEPCFDDLFRIAKSDWNYFSNNIYGVPDEACAACDGVSMSGVEAKIVNPSVMIGNRQFVECRLDHPTVVSGYVSGQDGKRLLNNNGVFSPIWRTVFGRPKPSPDFPTSFIPTEMRMQVVETYYEEYDEDLGENAFKTLIAGNVDNGAFLKAQMDAVIRSMATQPFGKKKTGKAATWKTQRRSTH